MQNLNDPRTAYHHSALDVSGAGTDLGYMLDGERLLPVQYAGLIYLPSEKIKADTTTAQVVGVLPVGVRVLQVMNLKAAGAGTAKIELPAVGTAHPAVTLAAATDVTSVAAAAAADMSPNPINRKLEVTVTGGQAGDTIELALLVCADRHVWK